MLPIIDLLFFRTKIQVTLLSIRLHLVKFLFLATFYVMGESAPLSPGIPDHPLLLSEHPRSQTHAMEHRRLAHRRKAPTPGISYHGKTDYAEHRIVCRPAPLPAPGDLKNNRKSGIQKCHFNIEKPSPAKRSLLAVPMWMHLSSVNQNGACKAAEKSSSKRVVWFCIPFCAQFTN